MTGGGSTAAGIVFISGIAGAGTAGLADSGPHNPDRRQAAAASGLSLSTPFRLILTSELTFASKTTSQMAQS